MRLVIYVFTLFKCRVKTVYMNIDLSWRIVLDDELIQMLHDDNKLLQAFAWASVILMGVIYL